MDRSDNIQSYIIGEDVVFTPSQRMIVDRLNSKELMYLRAAALKFYSTTRERLFLRIN